MHAQPDGAVVVVANRGPVGFVWADGRWSTGPTAGGLASMLTPLAHSANLVWACCVAEPPAAAGSSDSLIAVAARASVNLRLWPIALPAAIFHSYYNTISNEILWMLQHRLFGADRLRDCDASYRRAWDEGYLEANRRIADAMARSGLEARALLVQDYHLYPLPALLRRSCPGVPILHFTHIPFPPPSTWHQLPRPWSRSILQGLLGADIVGFQTARDARAFVSGCRDLLGLPGAADQHGGGTGVVFDGMGRPVVVRTYPASVDLASLQREMQSDAVQTARERLAVHADRRLIIRADRLDPAKNQLAGFRAFGRLLDVRPDLRRQIRFVACLVSSRTGLKAYQEYRAAVLHAIDEINTQYADLCGGPPIALYFETDRALALAAMERCDVLLANSLADGMNLVPKEWATVTRHDGVAVISESAGVAGDAAGAALLVASCDVEGTALALAEALDMPRAERAQRLGLFRRRVAAWTSRDWLSAQLTDLERTCGGRMRRPSASTHEPGGPAPQTSIWPSRSFTCSATFGGHDRRDRRPHGARPVGAERS